MRNMWRPSSLTLSMPWGELVGITWGNDQNPPVLVLHGRQDNCGTFDPLMPSLPQDYFYVCLDLPGHGKSSHFPPGSPLNFFDYVLMLKRVINQFSWKEVTILAHSFGGQISLYLAALYPEIVKKIIAFDCLGPECIATDDFVKYYRKQFDNFLKQEKKLTDGTPPSYSYEEALHRVRNNRWISTLTEEAGKTLIARSLVPSVNGYYFSTDQRFKIPVSPALTNSQQVAVFKQIQCPIFLILANESVKTFFSKDKSIKDCYDYLTTAAPNVSVRIVRGNHDVHLNNPERVLPFVKSFLSHDRSKL